MVPLLLFLGSFALYLTTLPGTISAYRDSGDMINAVTTLGIAHPPGYPLYVVIGKLFTQALPFANPAYRVNVLSAFCAAASAALLYRVIVTHLKNSPSPYVGRGVGGEGGAHRLVCVGSALVAALLYALSPAVLSLARVSEMYTLAAVVAVGVLACYAADSPRSLLLGSFLLGLGFAVHPTLLFLAPLLLPAKTQWRDAPRRLGFFLLGFSVVLVLLIRSRTAPLQNWGDPSTLERLWQLITRSNYGGLKLHPVESQFAWSLSSLSEQGVYFLKTLLRQWGWPGLLAGGWGLMLAIQRRSRRRLIICWLLAGPLFFLLSNLPLQENTTAPILEPYLILVNLIWAIWAAQGFLMLFDWAKRPAAQIILMVALWVLPPLQLSASLRSYRDHFYAYDLGRNIFRTVPEKSALYDPDDPIAFTLRMLQLREARHPDLALLNFFRTYWGYRQIMQRWPDLLPPVPIRTGQELEQVLWTHSLRQRPFYVDLPMKIPPPLSHRIEGLLYRVVPAARVSTPADLARAEQFFQYYIWRGSWRTPDHPDFFTRQILNYRAAVYANLGLKYAERRDWISARRCYVQALTVDPQLAPAYNNLGVADFEQGRYQDAIQHYQLALRFDPRNAGYQRNLELASQAAKQIKP